MTTQPDALPNTRKIDAAEARECLSRFVASHFRDGREHARFTIPANTNRDDDLLLGRFIDDAAATAAWTALCRPAHAVAEVERLLREAREVLNEHEHCRVLGGRWDYCRHCDSESGKPHKPSCQIASILARIDAVLVQASDNGHLWVPPTEHIKWEHCRICGLIRRADKTSNPCKGPSRVGPRQPTGS